MAKVIEHVEALYEVQDVEMGKVYRWCLDRIMVECTCGKRETFTAARPCIAIVGRNTRILSEKYWMLDRRRIRTIAPGALYAHIISLLEAPLEAPREPGEGGDHDE